MTQSTLPTSELTPQDIKTRKVELVLQQLESLPTLPTIALRLISLTGQNESSMREVVALISADLALTTKVLALVQSSASGLRHGVTTVQQAVVLLGFESVRNIVLSVKVFEAFQQEPGGPEKALFNRTEFWKHSLAVGTAAELLASRMTGHRVNRQDAFVCGLLHDIGKAAFDAVMPKSFDRAVEIATLTRGDIADAERRIIGLDHAVAGKRLAEAWNLPQLITHAIWLHGCAPMSLPAGVANQAMVQLVALADLLVRRQHIGFSGNYTFPFEVAQYQEILGLAEADIAACVSELAEQLEIRAKAVGLYEVQSREVYLQSIANANRELGRLNQTMAAQNRKLIARSECFDLLTGLYQNMVPAAGPAQLLRDMGEVFKTVFHCAKMVLFSQDPDETSGEALLLDAPGQTVESFLVSMPKWAGDQRVERNNGATVEPLRPASPQLDWLLDRVETFLGTKNAWFFPLMCGRVPIGGIVWPREPQPPALLGNSDLLLVSQAWGMTLRMAQSREHQNVLTEALTTSNHELAALQQQMVRARSLAHLGEMAAGAAHEMNNPLAVVCGRAQLLAGKLADTPARQDAQLIAQQGHRLSQIITDMMEFAKPEKPQPVPVVMVELVKQAVGDAIARCGGAEQATAVKLIAAADLPLAVVDVAQIRKAVTEIVVNAMQATAPAQAAGTPSITVHIRYDALDQQLIIQVADNGAGMTDATARQAFAPFFSSKPAGRQRGMGLSKALRWVELHGGTIRLDSMPHQGTTAVIILPLNNTPGLPPADGTAPLVSAAEAIAAPAQPTPQIVSENPPLRAQAAPIFSR